MSSSFGRVILGICLMLLLCQPLVWAQDGYHAQLTDDSGAQISLDKRPERIVSLSPSATEVLFALGLSDEIVGVTNYCDYPEAAKSKEKIGDLDLNYEKIVSLQPDLAVAVGNMPDQSIKTLRSLGIAVVYLSPVDMDTVMADIEKLGLITDRQEAARGVTADMRNRIAAVTDRLSGLGQDRKPSVFVEIWMDPVMTAGPGTFTSELIALAGGKDIAYDAAPWSPFSGELVVARDPQIIISQCESAAQILKRPGWGNIEAVRTRRVYDVDQNIFSRPGPRLVDALENLARLLHPEIFSQQAS